MPITTATILTHKLKNPDFTVTATATDSAAWMPLAEIQKTIATEVTGEQETITTTSYDVLFSGKLHPNSVTLNNLIPKSAASDDYISKTPVEDQDHYLTIPENAITSNTITSNAITTDKIVDAAITKDKIAQYAIEADAINNNSIYNRHIASITTSYPGVDGQKIQNSSLTLNKLNTRLKGVFINSINPDDMIKIDQTSTNNSYSVVLNDYEWSNLDRELTKDNNTYKLRAQYTGSNLISYNSKSNIFSFSPRYFSLYNSDLEEISRVEFSDNEVDSTGKFRVLSKAYFINKAIQILSQIVEYWEDNESNLNINSNLLSTIFATISIQSAYYDSTRLDSSGLFEDEILYATKDEFENALILKDDYDKLGIWIKI